MITDHFGLRVRWNALWRELSQKGEYRRDESFAHLLWLYSDPRRHYHTRDHLVQCFVEFDECVAKNLFERRNEAAFAIFLHDAIYETRLHGNESRSAGLAEEFLRLMGVDGETIFRIGEMIRFTNHGPVGEFEIDEDTKLVLDIDLSILGQPEHVFDYYDQNIRAEYWFVDPDVYVQKRFEIMDGFYGRWPLYKTDHFQHKYGAAARANLERLCARLECLRDEAKTN